VTRPPGGRAPARDAVAVLGTFLVLGVLSGVVWWVLVEPARYTKGRGGVAMGELELAERFAADGWYAVIAIIAGFVAGVGLTWWRTRDFRVTTLLLVPGSAIAAAAMAYVGGLLGPDGPEAGAELLRRGQSFPAQLVVSALPVYLMWPIAVLAGALTVLWSSPGVPPLPGTAAGAEQERDAGRPSAQRSPER
jgi:hypothetical protein